MSLKLLVGSRKGLLIFERSATGGWGLQSSSFDGIPVWSAIYDQRNNTLWAGVDHGHWGPKLHRSSNQGKSWDEVPLAYPADAYVKEQDQAKLDTIWTIDIAHSSRPHEIFIGTGPGGLFRSIDSGSSFQLVRALWDHPSRPDNWFGGGKDTPGLCHFWTNPQNPNVWVACISCGGVFVSEDNGVTWEGRNKGLRADFLPDPSALYGHDPHSTEPCLGSPEVWWQQNHCGIFRTTDSGRLWEEVSEVSSGAKFGWAICAHPTDPLQAWVVPAISDEDRRAVGGALRVCHTKNGGKTWISITSGLPQKNCYDIIYRKALAYHQGTLAFGSTTGNIYLSNPQGTQYECLGNHFPPVYSTRFAEY
jgi:hypothetical protein